MFCGAECPLLSTSSPLLIFHSKECGVRRGTGSSGESGDTRPWGLQISSCPKLPTAHFLSLRSVIQKELQYTVRGDSSLCEEIAGEREPDMHRCMLFFDAAFAFPVFSRTLIFALVQHIGLPVGHHIALHSQYCLGHTVALRERSQW